MLPEERKCCECGKEKYCRWKIHNDSNNLVYGYVCNDCVEEIKKSKSKGYNESKKGLVL